MNDEYSIATCKIKIENRENNINYENGFIFYLFKIFLIKNF